MKLAGGSAAASGAGVSRGLLLSQRRWGSARGGAVRVGLPGTSPGRFSARVESLSLLRILDALRPPRRAFGPSRRLLAPGCLTGLLPQGAFCKGAPLRKTRSRPVECFTKSEEQEEPSEMKTKQICTCIAHWLARSDWLGAFASLLRRESEKELSPKFPTNPECKHFLAKSCTSNQGHEDDERKVRRREKNRVAAQRSRKKQTQKADKLHEEYECLEQENTSLKREIGKLTDEMKQLTEVLRDHEKICPLLHCSLNYGLMPRHDALSGPLPR